jgi:hypothetical protein
MPAVTVIAKTPQKTMEQERRIIKRNHQNQRQWSETLVTLSLIEARHREVLSIKNLEVLV